MPRVLIHLIGPGGAGKSTTGPALAKRLSYRFIDLDQEYLKGSLIEQDIENYGYEYYVSKNVELYLSLKSTEGPTVMATSSGFMTYDASIHPQIRQIHQDILDCPRTVLLLPSFDEEKCVKETVRRQATKVHEDRDPHIQRARIVERFPVYVQMGSIKVSTDVPVATVVENILLQAGI
jgi:shikimate kinase